LSRQITLLTNSSSQGNIGMGDIEKLEVQLPPSDEQIAIATVLADMDTELTALEARRDKTRALKQGMMQELLTGKIRLV
ncbi:restriction endonuclease subunit S, partial [Rhodoferax sp.]|uniref:restriction endonuclease subunit S n=1 Tax=Rhodoferax sp. TaxID=50421 RepID=UPI001A0962EE